MYSEFDYELQATIWMFRHNGMCSVFSIVDLHLVLEGREHELFWSK